MNQDLKMIKKKYGESMMHFCREHFSTLLETEGLLQTLLLKHFHPSHDLFSDIKKENLESDFKNYIYSLVDVEDNNEIIVNKTPKELLSDAGYSLFECTTESDIQKFIKYYAKGEELCTFNGGRLEDCYVFFAVKKDVENIKREDYKSPKRQDEYGTSVISIQFTKDENHTLSIKNRYNHTVNNPDATFSNNLENIIAGLTQSFEKEYGLVQKYKNNFFEIPNYTKAKGKYYKFNYERFNIYYCPDNIIISNYKATQYEKEKYIFMDYFILDLVNKKVILYDERINDSFPETIGDIEKIKVDAKEEKKEIYLTPKEGEDIVITLDKENHIIGYKNENVKAIKSNFLYANETIVELSLPKVEKIGPHFLESNKSLKKINLSQIKRIGRNFLYNNEELKEIDLSNVEEIGNNFLYCNECLKNIYFPQVKEIGDKFLCKNIFLEKVSLPKVETVGSFFLSDNQALTKLSLPNLKKTYSHFLYWNKTLKELSLPNLEEVVGNHFMGINDSLKILFAPNLKEPGIFFLDNNTTLEKIVLGTTDNFMERFGRRYKDLIEKQEINSNFEEENRTRNKI